MTNELHKNILTAAIKLPTRIRSRSGSVFYSGSAAFSSKSRLYILGLNPGGSPVRQAANTIEADLRAWVHMPAFFSRYLDEEWEGRGPGEHGMQPRMRHLFDALAVDARVTPASNLVFVRSATEANLAAEKTDLLAACWPVHEAVLEQTGADTIICLGGTAGRWVREQLGAHQEIDTYSESNERGWTSRAHESDDGKAVVTLTHPGRADWRNPCSDPTAMVARVLARRS